MLDLGSATFSFSAAPLGRSRLARHAENLFAEFEARLATTLHIDDYAVHLELEEGSIKGRTRVLATLGALYVGIATYGSFRAGLREIHTDVATVNSWVPAAAASGIPNSGKPVVRRSSGVVGQIESVFAKVQRGELDVLTATEEVMDLVRTEDGVPPAFAAELKAALAACPRDPTQRPLLDFLDEHEGPGVPIPKRQPVRPPPVADRKRYRVEIWRESKAGKRVIQVLAV